MSWTGTLIWFKQKMYGLPKYLIQCSNMSIVNKGYWNRFGSCAFTRMIYILVTSEHNATQNCSTLHVTCTCDISSQFLGMVILWCDHNGNATHKSTLQIFSLCVITMPRRSDETKSYIREAWAPLVMKGAEITCSDTLWFNWGLYNYTVSRYLTLLQCTESGLTIYIFKGTW